MDAGAGPGRSSFVLAEVFKHVETFDYSYGFIDMLHKKKPEMLSKEIADRIIGYQGDAHEFKKIARKEHYNLIFNCNLIDRLYNPKTFVEQAVDLLTPDDGVLIISSPYTWKTEHTKIQDWIGGKHVDGEPYRTEDGLKDMISKYSNGKVTWFKTVKVPFVIPDSDGTFQFTFSNCTVFTNK